jgi:hypothetical protein
MVIIGTSTDIIIKEDMAVTVMLRNWPPNARLNSELWRSSVLRNKEQLLLCNGYRNSSSSNLPCVKAEKRHAKKSKNVVRPHGQERAPR